MVPLIKIQNTRNGTGSLGNSSLHLSLNLFYSRVESNTEMMAEKVLTVRQALTITDGIELLEIRQAANTLVQSYRSLSWEMVKNGSEHCHHHAYI